MELNVLELELNWPAEVPVFGLRRWILDELTKYGEPLRWAITRSEPSHEKKILRQLTIEAIIVISYHEEEE